MNNVWLVGSGGMAESYIKVLNALQIDFAVIGRGLASARKCEEATGCQVITGGLQSFLLRRPAPCSHAIVCVGVESLAETTRQLLEHGVTRILVEKPAALNAAQLGPLLALCERKQARVFVAYNRRFYASVRKARDIIAQDGGVTSFHFEFTEWAQVIEKLQKADGVLDHWFLANSTHVVDLAFHLGGQPRDMRAFTAGSLSWHPASAIFAGAGVSENGALFSYQANWESAGRWGVEVLTRHHRLILRPMEKLQIQKKGSVAIEEVACDVELDEQFKPGLFLQTRHFIQETGGDLCEIHHQHALMERYRQIAGYED